MTNAGARRTFDGLTHRCIIPAVHLVFSVGGCLAFDLKRGRIRALFPRCRARKLAAISDDLLGPDRIGRRFEGWRT